MRDLQGLQALLGNVTPAGTGDDIRKAMATLHARPG
jgi:hypothetical protein